MITFVSLVIGLIVFWPRLTVDAQGSIDPQNPRQIQFLITNTGFIKLVNVQPMLGICALGGFVSDINPPKACKTESYLVNKRWFVPSMSMDERYTLRIDDGINIQSLKVASITIAIKYYPWIIPIELKKDFGFVGKKEEDGKMYMLATPMP